MASSGFFQNVTSLRNANVPAIVLNETTEGYDVRNEVPIADRAILIERVSAIAGIALVAIALALITSGKGQALQSLGASQTITGAILLTAGVAFVWIAARGMRHQVKFDLHKQLLHFSTRNHADGYRVLRTVEFDGIESVFIKHQSAPDAAGTLYARVGDGEDLIEVARGSDAELEALMDRIVSDLEPQPAAA